MMRFLLKITWYVFLLSCSSCEKNAEASRLYSNAAKQEHRSKSTQDLGAQSGDFSLMIYNIAGLPWVVSSSSPVENTPHIGPLLNDFDIVLLQEDFWYHDLLVPGIHLPHRSTPQDADPTVFDLHDGLNRFSRFAFDALSRTTWEACSGYLSDSCDCLARKGFSTALMHLDTDVDIWVYNVHFDAGESEGDIAARKKQFVQLEKDIMSRVGNHALVVAGDLNLVTENTTDVENYLDFLDRMGLSDTCPIRGDPKNARPCEILFDRVLIKPSSTLDVSLQSFELPDHFINKSHLALSDHLPVSVVLEWKKIP